jgi:aryl-alcohol dehydrogenase-like predicted oxidoreductase
MKTGTSNESTSNKMSRFALGTVQFGQAYGISNTKGQPKENDVRDILDLAASSGIRTLDTAPAYGNSERVLGRLLTSSDPFNIVTKTPALREIDTSLKPADIIVKTFENSLRQMNRDQLYGLIVHLAEDLLGPSGDNIWNALESLKSAGSVRSIGVSCYNVSQIKTLTARYPINLIQTPFNVFDQALIQNGLINDLKKSRIEVHIRSALLQGLVVMDPNNLPDGFTRARPHIQALHDKASSENLTPLELALGFVRSVEQIDQMVIGVTDKQELQGIIDALAHPLSRTIGLESLAVDDEAVITPSQWPPDTQESWAFDFSTTAEPK